MTHTPPEKTRNPPPQASAGDKQQLEKFRDLLRSQVAAAKATLAPWLGKSPDRTKYIAMLELAFDHYLDIHDEAEALELIHLNFHSTVQRRKGPLQ